MFSLSRSSSGGLLKPLRELILYIKLKPRNCLSNGAALGPETTLLGLLPSQKKAHCYLVFMLFERSISLNGQRFPCLYESKIDVEKSYGFDDE
jgi:hypothetical protein